jgi:hypothetical protein
MIAGPRIAVPPAVEKREDGHRFVGHHDPAVKDCFNPAMKRW